MNSLMMNNAIMVDNGHFGDGDVAVLASIMVWLRKWGAGTVGGSVAGRTRLCSP